MATRRMKRIDIDFDAKWCKPSAMLMAVSLFARAVYYFGVKNLLDVNFIEIILCAFGGLAVAGWYLFSLYVKRQNAPGLYGLLGALLCVILIVWSFFSGSFLRVILAAAWYCVAGGVILFTTTGKMSNKSLCTAMFLIPIAVRFFVFDIGRLGIFDWILELSYFMALGAIACIPSFLKITRR